MNRFEKSERTTIGFIAGSLLIFALIRIWHGTEPLFYNRQYFLGIHTLLELFSIFISFSIFLQSWYALADSKRAPLLFGILFFCVGTLDLAHTFAYKGMPFLADEHSVTRATWLWIMARMTESIGLSVIFIGTKDLTARGLRRKPVFLLAMAYLGAVILFIVLRPQYLPILVEDGEGVTPLKLALEYVISLIHLVNMIVILRLYRRKKDEDILSILTGTVYILLGELVFTLYKGVFDLENLLGHVFKAAGYFFLMKGIFFPRYQEVLEEKEQAETQWRELEGKLKENERRMTTLVIEAQEEERKRVSRELHDGIGQAL